MNRQRETNPHFFTPEHSQTSEWRSQPRQGSTYHFPTEPRPEAPLQHKNHTPERHHGSSSPILAQQQTSSQPTTPYFSQHSHSHHNHNSSLRVPPGRKTKPFAWIVAAFCAIFWVIIIVGGLIVLIIYLVFRPRSPKFDIVNASLNAAYLDMGYLLNCDVTLLVNVTNGNRKVNVDFTYIVMDLKIQDKFIATTYVKPLTVMSGQSRLELAHIIASQVPLSSKQSQELQKEMDNGRVKLHIKGFIRARSKLGGIFRYSYWLYSTCDIIVSGPPNGAILGRRCVTKR